MAAADAGIWKMASVGRNVVGFRMVELGLDQGEVVEAVGLNGVVDGEILEDSDDEVG